MACDGEQYWGIHENRARVGPARPMAGDIASLVGSSWLLGERLSGGVEITYHGRRGYHLRVTRSDGAAHAGPTMFYPADAIVNAATGSLLRLIAYDGYAPAEWWQLYDVTSEPGDTATRPDSARTSLPAPSSSRKPATLITDYTAAIPGLAGTAARAAAEAFRCGTNAVSAARSFLDDLRGHR